MYRARVTRKCEDRFPCEELGFISQDAALAFIARRSLLPQLWALELLDPGGRSLFFFCRED